MSTNNEHDSLDVSPCCPFEVEGNEIGWLSRFHFQQKKIPLADMIGRWEKCLLRPSGLDDLTQPKR